MRKTENTVIGTATILGLHPDDAFKPFEDKLIGQKVEVTEQYKSSCNDDEYLYLSGYIDQEVLNDEDTDNGGVNFYAVKIDEIVQTNYIKKLK